MGPRHHAATDTCQTEHSHLLLPLTSLLLYLKQELPANKFAKKERETDSKRKSPIQSHSCSMAASVMASLSLKPSPFLDRSRFTGVRPSARSSTFRVMAKKTKKIQTSQPFGPAGGLNLKDGVDASGRLAKLSVDVARTKEIINRKGIAGKGVYQFANKYGANVDGYSPIYNPEEWSPSGDVYVGGKTGLLLWAVTLAGILLGGALLVYNTSALAS
ncbi:unnamed protein product [Miscanthus lutarioriparius]|uniref:Photosystem II 10 kDa polypeptide, chloroplastic n=1 Tax=Miscanthus lutarioriparius TaxID=422564 RepID=A0A811NCC7_9POAL|nr:unnamed protein product [Miscanthus lutarioriparius]